MVAIIMDGKQICLCNHIDEAEDLVNSWQEYDAEAEDYHSYGFTFGVDAPMIGI